MPILKSIVCLGVSANIIMVDPSVSGSVSDDSNNYVEKIDILDDDATYKNKFEQRIDFSTGVKLKDNEQNETIHAYATRYKTTEEYKNTRKKNGKAIYNYVYHIEIEANIKDNTYLDPLGDLCFGFVANFDNDSSFKYETVYNDTTFTVDGNRRIGKGDYLVIPAKLSYNYKVVRDEHYTNTWLNRLLGKKDKTVVTNEKRVLNFNTYDNPATEQKGTPYLEMTLPEASKDIVRVWNDRSRITEHISTTSAKLNAEFNIYANDILNDYECGLFEFEEETYNKYENYSIEISFDPHTKKISCVLSYHINNSKEKSYVYVKEETTVKCSGDDTDEFQ